MDLRQYQTRAEQKQREHKQFLKWLAQKKPKDLDVRMAEFHQEVFDRVDCLDCANCCRSTGPLFTTQDVKRIAKKLNQKEADFERNYLRRDEEGDLVLRQLPCPFLGHDNRCAIYEFRPKACREFPHTDRRKFYQINALTIKNVKICPAAFEIVEQAKNFYTPK